MNRLAALPDVVPDPVGAAVDAVEAQAHQVQMAQSPPIALMGNPARPMMIALPLDVTDMEVLNAIAQVLAFGDQLRARRAGASRLIIPGA